MEHRGWPGSQALPDPGALALRVRDRTQGEVPMRR